MPKTTKKIKARISAETVKEMEKERKASIQTTRDVLSAEAPKKVEKFETGSRSKKTRLEYLEEGRAFEVVGCEKILRNLFVKRTSESSVLVGGERQEEKDIWANLGAACYFAPATIVVGL